MRLPEQVVEFLGGPSMILLGTRSAVFKPGIGRAIGLRLAEEADRIDLMLSRWQWPQTAANIASNGQLAVTFSRPSDYVTYQLKGLAELRDAEPDDLALGEKYVRRMGATLSGLGVGSAMTSGWFCTRDVVVARLAVEAVFVQTPGASAGSTIAPDRNVPRPEATGESATGTT